MQSDLISRCRCTFPVCLLHIETGEAEPWLGWWHNAMLSRSAHPAHLSRLVTLYTPSPHIMRGWQNLNTNHSLWSHGALLLCCHYPPLLLFPCRQLVMVSTPFHTFGGGGHFERRWQLLVFVCLHSELANMPTGGFINRSGVLEWRRIVWSLPAIMRVVSWRPAILTSSFLLFLLLFSFTHSHSIFMFCIAILCMWVFWYEYAVPVQLCRTWWRVSGAVMPLVIITAQDRGWSRVAVCVIGARICMPGLSTTPG